MATEGCERNGFAEEMMGYGWRSRTAGFRGGRPDTAVRGGLDMDFRPIVACFPFIGDEIGGSHISAIKLIQSFDTKLIRPIVMLHVTEGPVADHLRESNVAFMKAPGGAFPVRRRFRNATTATTATLGFALRAALPLTRFLRKTGVDLVHTNDGRMHACWALPSKLAGAAHIWHHRGDPDALGVNYIAPFCASRIITVSRFARPRRALFGVERKVSVIHSPFEVPPIGDKAKARAMLLDVLGCALETRFLGYFGLLIDRKRPVAFVESVAAYIQSHPDTPVMGLLFGVPGHEEPDLDRVVLQRAEQLGIGSQIRLMGFRRPVEPWMQAVDILLVPAVREPFGRTLIEAMFLGTPVVATDDGGNREAIEDGVTGFLVPPGEPDRFVAPIHMLLTDRQRKESIVRNAQKNAFASYGVGMHVNQVTEIYRSLCGNKRRAVAEPARVG